MLDAQIGTYQAVQTTTADPARLVLLLFDGAARFLRQALRGLDRGDAAGFAYSLSRAHAIIAELSDSLNRDEGGEVAANLGGLYAFLLRHLTQGLVAKRRDYLEQALSLLQTLREGFEGAVEADGREPAR